MPPRNRRTYLVEFDDPDSDGEFLATCLGIGDLLAVASDLVADWTQGLADRGLPAPILAQFDHATDGLDQAAIHARQAAMNFADYFEDARKVAARGLRIVGTSGSPGRRPAWRPPRHPY
ncbi:hypothetical protein [Actinomadura rupiterrae]|uniref:hypothetical protein n=1 Tax=Actinomadura rupiterrae TaxID=559627 RepID=UPI0020A2588F|nr:hypothetical protein [Actinomadura rupiterrae]MCP2337883.1 hypothetical protein [Actinomadura rupiterrae]